MICTRYLRAALLPALFCSACNVAPKYVRPAALPPAAFPAGFKELKANDQWKFAEPGDAALRGKWWEIFGDAKLNELEEKISVDNQNVKQAEAQFLAARASIDQQHAGYFPAITSSPSASRNQGSGVLTSAANNRQSSSMTLSSGATWEADVWGRIHTAVEGATANAQVVAANLENVRLSLQGTLAADYFTIASIDMQIALLRDTVEGYQKYLTLTINRFNGGVAAKSDIALAQTQLSTTQAQLTDLGVARAQFEHAIAVLTGQAPAGFSLPPLKIAAPPPPIPLAVPSKLLERRPDVAAAERQIALQNANLGLAKIAFYPTVTLSGSAGLQASGLQNLFTWPAHIWSVGPGISETLFDFGRRDAALELSMANYDASVATYRQTVLTAFQNVEDDLAALRVLAEEATQVAEAVAAAEQSLSLITERYKAGTNSYLDVINTQTIALNNERTAVTVLQRRMTASVALVQALGGGWDASALPTYDQLRSHEMADPKNTHEVAQPGTNQAAPPAGDKPVSATPAADAPPVASKQGQGSLLHRLAHAL